MKNSLSGKKEEPALPTKNCEVRQAVMGFVVLGLFFFFPCFFGQAPEERETSSEETAADMPWE